MDGLLFGLIELLVQLLVEIIANIFGNAYFAPVEEGADRQAVFAFVFYALFGICAGIFSVWLFPNNFVKSQYFNLFGLIINPLVCGFALYWFKRRDDANGEPQRSLSNFANGWICVFLIALIRFFAAN